MEKESWRETVRDRVAHGYRQTGIDSVFRETENGRTGGQTKRLEDRNSKGTERQKDRQRKGRQGQTEEIREEGKEKKVG